VPVLAEIGKAPLLVEWNDFDTGALVPDFEGRLKSELDRLGVKTDARLYFICRSGSRSRNAAVAATAIGYAHSYNVEHGFEGSLGPDRHRGTAGSWKGEGLPWMQT
jgi:rhodanese-related sulfurtransferase